MEFPAFSGNWIDLVILFFVLLSLFGGWKRGFLGGFFDLLSFILAFLLALKFYPLGAKFLMTNFSFGLGIAKASAFLLIAIFSELFIAFLLELFYEQVPSALSSATPNKLFGFLTAASQTLIFTAFILTLTLVLPIKGMVKGDILSSKIGGELVRQTQGIEEKLRQVFGGAVEETLNFFTIKPESKETVELGFVQKDLEADSASEKSMFALVNQARKEKGIAELVWDEKLAVVARAHAYDMFERGYFSHYTPEGLSPSERLEKAEILFLTTGENLALAPNADLAHQGLMRSPGHRANILSGDYDKVGIGVVDGGIYGKMFVQEFTD